MDTTHEPGRDGILGTPLPALDDPEGEAVNPGLPDVIDAHVHVFPDSLFEAIRQWFDCYGWPIRYRLTAQGVIGFLLSRNVRHVVCLQYAHRPGIARELNTFMAGLCGRNLRVTGLATVFPGEAGAKEILLQAFETGLRGVKLHLHVQCLDILSPAMEEVYSVCEEQAQPLVIHAGREPKGPGYACDPYALCGAAKMEEVVKAHPDLKVCVPHLGADEFKAYRRMIERYDNLWLDTTMTVTDYLFGPTPPLSEFRADRILYGSDFPNLPYAWDRELKGIETLGLPREFLGRLLAENALEFFAIPN